MANLPAEHLKELAEIIVEKAPIGICALDNNGIIDAVNKQMLEILGKEDEREIVGLNALEAATYKAVGLDKFFRAGLRGAPFECEVSYARRSGEKPFWYHYFGIPIVGRDNKAVEHLLLLVENITVRKEAQGELALRVNEMERLNKLMIGRELKMIELKKENEELKKKLSEK